MQNVHDSSVLIRLLIQSRQDRGQTFDADGRLGKQDVNRVQDKQLNSASRARASQLPDTLDDLPKVYAGVSSSVPAYD
mgnify:CR=1 FL=1